MQLHIVVLAAGKGKRMRSDLPKVLHQLGGLPLLERVVNTANALAPAAIHVVYGNGGGRVRKDMSKLDVSWIEQCQQLGTGHAVQQALPHLSDSARVLMLYGDVPLISAATLQRLLDETASDQLGLLVAELKDPSGLGRIIRDKAHKILQIVEHKDASPEQLAVNEINTGIMCCPADLLKKWLPLLSNHNHQQEYYLTDIVAMAVQQGVTVNGVKADCPFEIKGVNDLWQLATLERYFQEKTAQQFALAGVTLRDPSRLTVRGDRVKIGRDVVIDVNVIIEGDVVIGDRCQIGPNVILKDTTLGSGVEVLANSMIVESVVGDHCRVGPFARLRPGAQLSAHVSVGNFVEIKKTTIGSYTKVNHLTYLGDARVGEYVNIGAGTITCNYDGANKWETIIKEHAFIGSNVALVAPVTIGQSATIAAGSTIDHNAPAHQLSIARCRQTHIRDWQRPDKQAKSYTPPVTASASVEDQNSH